MKRREALMTICATATATAIPFTPATAAGRRPTKPIKHGFHAKVTAKRGMGDALVEFLFSAPSFENPDCLVFLIGRSASDRDVIFITEGWSSEAAHSRFRATELAKSYITKLGRLTHGESSIIDEIPIGGKAVLS